jgi:hypothetical protein
MRRQLPWVLGCFALVALLLAALAPLTGVRALHRNHVIATFEIRGAASDAEARGSFAGLDRDPTVRHVSLTRSSWADSIWIARVQFEAPEPGSARRRIQEWMRAVSKPVTVRLVKAGYYPYRIHRPARGDITLGEPLQLGLVE